MNYVDKDSAYITVHGNRIRGTETIFGHMIWGETEHNFLDSLKLDRNGFTAFREVHN